MQKIKIFSIKSGIGWPGVADAKNEQLEADVNEFIANKKIKVTDLQYRMESTDSQIVISVMVVYQEN